MATHPEPMSAPLDLLKHRNLVDFSEFDDLPESHAWPELENHPLSLSGKISGELVPVIDIGEPDVLSSLANACKRWGVFTITGHGVPSRTLQRLEFQSQRLFSLPAEQKFKALRPANSLSGYGQARISNLYPKLMWSEGFTIAGSPEEHARKLWPGDGHLAFCDALEEYRRELKRLAEKLLTLILKSMDLPIDEVSCYMGACSEEGERGFSAAQAIIQLNSYPPCPNPERAMGMADHTDSSIFTIVYQNLVSGMQVLSPEGRGWATVPCVEEGLVVNIGDLLHMITNGRCTNVVHRALVDKTRHRLSVAFIYGPPAEAKIAPIGSRREMPLYRPVTWPEYLGIKAKFFAKALESIRVSPKGGGEDEDEE